MTVVSSKEFVNNQRKYFKMAVNERICIKRGKSRFHLMHTIDDDDEDFLNKIPAEYRCDPFIISPSGDPFWADIRNVEKLNQSLESIEKNRKKGNNTICKTYEESLKYLDNL